MKNFLQTSYDHILLVAPAIHTRSGLVVFFLATDLMQAHEYVRRASFLVNVVLTVHEIWCEECIPEIRCWFN